MGRFGHLTPEQARGLAQATLAEVRRGGDPAEERRGERAAITVDELARRFLSEHIGAKRKGTTAAHYRSLKRVSTGPLIWTTTFQLLELDPNLIDALCAETDQATAIKNWSGPIVAALIQNANSNRSLVFRSWQVEPREAELWPRQL
ncbi:Phage integrase family protein [Methylocystis sp. SC2]|nr:Phage integrase family protein [Methylocystis sp. SC2]